MSATSPAAAPAAEPDDDQLEILLAALRRTASKGGNHGTAAYTVDRLGRQIKTLEQAYKVCLGRAPDVEAQRQFPRRGPMWGIISALLESVEFRSTILVRLLHRHEDTKRGFYIHVPKTAGTTVTRSLESRDDWHVWTTALQDPILTPLDELLCHAHVAAKRLAGGLDRFWCVGHTSLARWQDLELLNDDAIVFATTRHPFELYVSMANYAVGHIAREPLHRLSLRWASWLYAETAIEDASLKSLAAAMLTSEGFTAENADVYVRYLGGFSATAVSTFHRVRGTGCSLVPVAELPAFLESLGVDASRLGTLNASGRNALRVTDLGANQLGHLTDRLAAEDLKYWALEQYFC